ncbi:lipopolysaccharide biosynthesis protein [Clostridium baratii]|uniref:lipopolysaccharide biosynthesis protein n=1 Tax=Clostridium baratii TaxID=1561 RepID=UPI0030CA75A6
MQKNSRKKMVYLNTIITLITQILSVLLGFGIRKIFIDKLGVVYLGYNSVFVNILQMLNLADLGIGIAITSFLYKPLADNDEKRITALMHIYKKVYQILGIIVFIFGVVISIFIPIIIPDAGSNYTYLRILFFINLIGTVSSYYLAYKRTLLIADQKSYYATFVDMIIYLGTSLLQIIILYKVPNYILYLVIGIAKNIISNLILSIKCSKKYKYLSNKADKEIINEYRSPIKQYVKDVFIARLGSYIFYSTDNIVISMFKGSLLTGYLSNYTLITTQVTNVIGQILASVQATFGNYINSEESLSKQEEMTNNYLLVNYFIGNFCMICIMFLIQPFINLFFGSSYTLPLSTAIWLSLNLMLTILIQLPSQLFMIYKLYKYDKIIVSISATLNVIVSITLVQLIGINGVLIGTFITSLIYLYSRLAIVTRKIYHTSFIKYLRKFFYYFCISLITVVFTYICTKSIPGNSIVTFAFRMVIVAIIPIIVPTIFLLNSKEFKYLIEKFVPLKIRKRVYNVTKLRILSLFGLIVIICTIIINIFLSNYVNSINNNYKEREQIFRSRIENMQSKLKSEGYNNSKYINISFDDTINIFKDITQHSETYDSIFDNSTLEYVRDLHNLYGANFTFYCMYEDSDGFNLKEVTDKYSKEFEENSKWLKFGFHSLTWGKNYANTDADEARNDYNLVVNQLVRITGSKECIERVVRLHNYAGNFSSIKAMNETNNGIVGLLSADDDRKSYYLNNNECNKLKVKGKISYEGMSFLSTDIRLENTEDIKSKLNAKDNELIVFTHEWLLNDKLNKEKLEEVCKFAINNGYSFNFPVT